MKIFFISLQLSSENGLHLGIIENKFSFCALFAPFLHFVSLRWEYVIFLKGWVLQTYSYRRLSTLCSDALKSRKFQRYSKDLATLDVLRVCYNHTYVAVCSYTSPCCGINIYNILAWASRCRF